MLGFEPACVDLSQAENFVSAAETAKKLEYGQLAVVG